MLVGYSERDLQEWKNDMYGYEKNKRTKKPFGKQFSPNPQRVTESMVKQQQRQFDPILQKYSIARRQHEQRMKEDTQRNTKLLKYLKFANKNAREYDIVNLYGSQSARNSEKEKKENPHKAKAPLRNAYNPINNQPLPQCYYRNRDVKIAKNYNFKKISPEPRQFNIVTGQYHEQNEDRQAWDQYQKQRQIYEKLQKTRKYNPVFGRYYDPKKQQEQDEKLAQSQLLHGSHYQDRFPPSYRKRQPLILDREKPPTQSLIELDKKRSDAKQRFKLKYLLQEEYARRNLEQQDKKEAQLRNRVHNSHLLQMKAKQFDIVNMSNYQPRRAESLMGRQAVHSTWDRLNDGKSSGGSSRRAHSGIKSSGFC